MGEDALAEQASRCLANHWLCRSQQEFTEHGKPKAAAARMDAVRQRILAKQRQTVQTVGTSGAGNGDAHGAPTCGVLRDESRGARRGAWQCNDQHAGTTTPAVTRNARPLAIRRTRRPLYKLQ